MKNFTTLLVFLIGCGEGAEIAIDATGADGSAPDAADPDPDAADSDAEPPPRVLEVESCQDLGALPLPSAVTVARDGGEGGVLGGRYLWTFGDTFTTADNSIDGSNVLSATSGWASLDTPMTLVEPVDGAGIPAQLIPYTDEEIAANQADALNGWALWPGAVIDVGGGEAVVVFQRIKRTDGTGFESVAVGTARIAIDGTVATRASTYLFAPPEPLFVPVSVVDDHVYAFACAGVGFLNIGCRVARAPVTQADVRDAYTFFDGTQWQSDPAAAVVVIDQAGNKPALSFNPHLDRYLAVNAPVLSSTVLLRTADQVEGPWSTAVQIPVGDCILAPVPANKWNYIIIDHPELASADGRSIVISYSRPTGPFRVEVRLARITLR